MNFDQKLNLFLLASLALLLLSLGAYSYLLYGIEQFKDSTAKIGSELGTNLSRETTQSGVKAVLKATEEERAKLDTYFIEVKGTPRFLEALAKLGKDAGVSLSLDSIDVENTSVLRVNFHAQGTFKNLFHLASLLEASPYALEMGNLSLNKVNILAGKSGEAANLWSGNGTIRLISFVNE